MLRVDDIRGSYRDFTGPFMIRPGYYIRYGSKGEQFFAMAGMLVPVEEKNNIGHLRLVRRQRLKARGR